MGCWDTPRVFLLLHRRTSTFKTQGWRLGLNCLQSLSQVCDTVRMPHTPVGQSSAYTSAEHSAAEMGVGNTALASDLGSDIPRLLLSRFFFFSVFTLFILWPHIPNQFFLHWLCIFVTGWWWTTWASCLRAAKKWMLHLSVPTVLPHVHIWESGQREETKLRGISTETCFANA